MGRAKIAVINSSLSVANLVITNLLQFLNRTVLIYILGVQYAGLSGLCQSIISIFALSELGVSWAISYYLYKPLKEHNYRQVAEIIYYLRRLYIYVGIFILVAGMAVVPFLNEIIKGAEDIPHLKLIFSLYFVNTACSYLFFSYYQILANADRKNYALFVPQTCGNIIMVCLQIAAVYFFHSFVLAVTLMTLSTIATNYVIRCKVIKLYPLLSEYKGCRIESRLKKEIVRYIKSTMLYKVSLTVMSSSTSIIISHYIGLVILGLYANYMLIVDTIRSVILSLINPMTAVIGEITANASETENRITFKRLNFLMSYICYFCSISLYCLLTPFITLWIGKDLTLPNSTIILITVYFYVEFIISFSTQFRSACGLNNIGKFRPLITAGLNVILAILFAEKYGINGIILALLISRLTTLTWFEPWVIHRYVLNKSVWPYYLRLIVNGAFTLIVILGMKWLVDQIWNNNWLSFIIAMFCCLIIPNLLFYVIYGRSAEFKYFLYKLKSIKR